MRAERQVQPLFESCEIPAEFVDACLPVLSGTGVKLYLVLFRASQRGDRLSDAVLMQRCSCTTAELRAAVGELEQAELLTIDPAGQAYLLRDPRERRLHQMYRPRQGADPDPMAERPKTPEQARRDQRQQSLIQNISNTYFQGLMSANWFYDIEEMIERYRFESAVIYSLFSECKRRNKLNRSYVRTVAEDWHQRGVITFEDLARVSAARQASKSLSNRIGERLGRLMTPVDEDAVNRWMTEYGYDMDVIEIALEKTTGIQSPNLNYVGKILAAWHKAGLKNEAAVRQYEADKEADKARRLRQTGRTAGAAAGRQSTGRRDNVGNFSQRRYSEGYFSDRMVTRQNLDVLKTGCHSPAVTGVPDREGCPDDKQGEAGPS